MGVLIQIEMGAGNIALSLREQIKRQKFCFTDVINSPAGALVVSQIVIGNAWLRASTPSTSEVAIGDGVGSGGSPRWLQTFKVQIVQAIMVSVSTLAQLEAAGAGAPDVTQTVELHLIFNLEADWSANDVALLLEPTDPENAPDGFDVSKIRDLFPLTRLPIDLSKLTGLPGPLPVANAGVSAFVDPSEQGPLSENHTFPFNNDSFVLVRIEMGPFPVDTSAWEQFFSSPQQASFAALGVKKCPFSGNFWRFFLDKYFLVEQTRSGISDGLSKPGSKSNPFRLQGGIDVKWAPDYSFPVLSADFYGDAVDACDLGILGKYDVGAHILGRFVITVPDPPPVTVGPGDPLPFQPGSIQFDVDLGSSLIDPSVCALENMVLWPYVGINLMETGMVDLSDYCLGVLLPPLVVVGVFKAAGKGLSSLSPEVPGANCTQPDTNKPRYVCTKPFDTSTFPLGGQARLLDFAGLDEGLLLLGNFNWNQRLSRLFHISDITTEPFAARAFAGSCHSNAGSPGAPSQAGVFYEASVFVSFEVEPLDPPHLEVSGSPTDVVPPYICQAFVRPADDPQNVYRPFVTVDDSTPKVAIVNIQVPLGAVPSTFVAPNSYPCKLIIQTSAGARMIKLDPMEVITADQADSLRIKAIGARISECYAKHTPGGYNPLWGIDPLDPPDVYVETQLWRILIGEISSGPTVGLHDGAGAVVAHANPRPDGGAELNVIAHGTGYPQGLSFFQAPSLPAASTRSLGEAGSFAAPKFLAIDMQQTQLLRISTLSVGTHEESFCLSSSGSRAGVVVLLEGELWRFEIASLDLALPCGFSKAPADALGVLAAGWDYLVWGSRGLHVAHLDASTASFAFKHVSEAPVRAIAQRGGRVFILRDEGVEICRTDGIRIASIEAPQARTLAAGAAHLLVACEHCVDVYAIGEDVPRKIDAIEFPCANRIKPWDVFGRTDDFFIEGGLGSTLVAVGREARITQIAENANLPALSRLSREGRIYAEYDQLRRQVHVYKVGKTQWS